MLITAALLTAATAQVCREPPPSHSWEHCALEVRPSEIPNAGSGLFATDGMRKGERVGFYDGYDFLPGDAGSEEAMLSPYKQEDPTTGGFRDGKRAVWYDAAIREYEINARRDNNVGNGPKDDPFTYTMLRDVDAGEELYHEYGVNFWLQQLIEGDNPPPPLTALLLCMARGMWEAAGGFGAASCVTLQEQGSEQLTEFFYDAPEKRLAMRRGSKIEPLGERYAGAFIVKYLRLRPTSPVWRRFAPAEGETAAVIDVATRLHRAVAHLLRDGEAWEVEPELS